jgi:hypothetical protein
MVFIRPELVVIHDQAQVANAAVKKYFNVNFNSMMVTKAADIFTSVTGDSKVFMRTLVPANPSPTILAKGAMANDSYNTPHPLLGSNYQDMLTGQTVDTFLHLFQLTESGRASMSASAYLKTGDGRAQGTEVDVGGRRWVVLFSVSAPQLTGGTLSYTVPMVCPCTHVLADLAPQTTYQISAGGNSMTATSDSAGVISFVTDDATSPQVQITLP